MPGVSDAFPEPRPGFVLVEVLDPRPAGSRFSGSRFPGAEAQPHHGPLDLADDPMIVPPPPPRAAGVGGKVMRGDSEQKGGSNSGHYPQQNRRVELHAASLGTPVHKFNHVCVWGEDLEDLELKRLGVIPGHNPSGQPDAPASGRTVSRSNWVVFCSATQR